MRLTLLALPIGICLIVGLGCDVQHNASKSQVNKLVADFAALECNSEDDVRKIVSHAAAARRSILFIQLDWAFMYDQHRRFAEFSIAHSNAHPESNVGFYYVDCTPVTSGYAPLHELNGWDELEAAAGTSLIHGWGEVAWLENGRVLHVEPILNFDSVDDLIEKTQDLFLDVK